MGRSADLDEQPPAGIFVGPEDDAAAGTATACADVDGDGFGDVLATELDLGATGDAAGRGLLALFPGPGWI